MNGLTMKCKECSKTDGDMFNTKPVDQSGDWYCGHCFWFEYLNKL